MIVAVELSEIGIKQFFEDQGLQYKEEPVSAIPGAKVFKVYIVGFFFPLTLLLISLPQYHTMHLGNNILNL